MHIPLVGNVVNMNHEIACIQICGTFQLTFDLWRSMPTRTLGWISCIFIEYSLGFYSCMVVNLAGPKPATHSRAPATKELNTHDQVIENTSVRNLGAYVRTLFVISFRSLGFLFTLARFIKVVQSKFVGHVSH